MSAQIETEEKTDQKHTVAPNGVNPVTRMVVTPEVIAQVNALLQKGFEIPLEKLNPDSTLGPDLGLDSLDAVDMLVYIEENMNVKVDGEHLRAIKTLQDVYQLAAHALSNAPQPTHPPQA